jgi:hypothetical protein
MPTHTEIDVIADIVHELGEPIKPKQLATLLDVDNRTVVKYAARWGGIEVAPGVWRFFKNRIREVLNDGQFTSKAGKTAMARPCDGAWSREGKVVSRPNKDFRACGRGLGRKNPKENGKGGKGRKDRDRPKSKHGIRFY